MLWFKSELYKYKMADKVNIEVSLKNSSKNVETVNDNVYLHGLLT
jgi:hypothetical protein